jgi:hypothetical protein
MMGFGYAGAISKFRNFSGWQKTYKNYKTIDNRGNAKITLPLDFYAYKFSIHLIASTSVTFPK